MNGIKEIIRQNREIAAALREIIEGGEPDTADEFSATEGGRPAPLICGNGVPPSVPHATFVADKALYVIITPVELSSDALLRVALRVCDVPHLIAEGKFILQKDDGDEICRVLSLSGCTVN